MSTASISIIAFDLRQLVEFDQWLRNDWTTVTNDMNLALLVPWEIVKSANIKP